MATDLKAAADSPELEAAWRYIQADFRKVMAKRERLYAGKVGFWELLFSRRSLSGLISDVEKEVSRLHSMLKAIDEVRGAARETASISAPKASPIIEP